MSSMYFYPLCIFRQLGKHAMILIFIAVTFFTALVLFAYIKLKYPFWNIQPVFHVYDYWRYFYTLPFIVFPYRPIKTKFCDFRQVLTLSYLEASSEQRKQFTDLLQCYFYDTDRIFNTMLKEDIHAYFGGANDPPFLSFYVPDYGNPHKPMACISSRSMSFYYRPGPTEEVYTKQPVYIIDYLCVSRDLVNKKREISRKLLQTHEYNQRIRNPSITVSLIKAEVELFDGVVPLFQYVTCTYQLRSTTHIPPLPTHFQVVEIYKENLDILSEFLYTQSHLDFRKEPCEHDIFVVPDMGVLISLIRRRLLYIYCIQREGTIYGMYFIKNAKIRYEDIDGNTLHLVGSILDYRHQDRGELHYVGLLHSLRQIIHKKPSFKMFLIDELGHNKMLTNYWRNAHTPLFKNDAAIYLYNMIYPRSPIPAERCFFLA